MVCSSVAYQLYSDPPVPLLVSQFDLNEFLILLFLVKSRVKVYLFIWIWLSQRGNDFHETEFNAEIFFNYQTC